MAALTRRQNDTWSEFVAIHCESGVQALASTSPTAATCTVTVDTNANMADGNIVTINSGIRKQVYEYDKSANGVTVPTAGSVPPRATWAAGAGTAAQSATTLATAIAAWQPELTVVDNGDGTLTLTTRILGAVGNNTNSCTAVGVLAITNFTGGTDPALAATVAATTTQKFCKVPRDCRVESVQWLTQTTVTQDASNYWDIELKDGSTSVAKWSTLTTAQGTITGGTGVTLVNSGTDASLVFAAGDTMSLVLTKHGSPAALPPGRLTVHGHYVS